MHYLAFAICRTNDKTAIPLLKELQSHETINREWFINPDNPWMGYETTLAVLNDEGAKSRLTAQLYDTSDARICLATLDLMMKTGSREWVPVIVNKIELIKKYDFSMTLILPIITGIVVGGLSAISEGIDYLIDKNDFEKKQIAYFAMAGAGIGFLASFSKNKTEIKMNIFK